MSFRTSKIIETNLTGDTMYDVCRSVIGQLSDGIWENSPVMNKYWRNISVKKTDDEKIQLEVNTESYINGYHKTYDNPFHKMDDFQIKFWFADKIKQIAYGLIFYIFFCIRINNSKIYVKNSFNCFWSIFMIIKL